MSEGRRRTDAPLPNIKIMAAAPLDAPDAPDARGMLVTAQRNAHKLLKYFEMGDAEFAQLSKEVRGQTWWNVLGVPMPTAAQPKNVIKALATLRSVFVGNAWLERGDSKWIRLLVEEGRVMCAACCGNNSKHGLMQASADKVDRHLKNEKVHGKNVKLYDNAQLRIDTMAGGAGHGGASAAALLDVEHRHLVEALLVGKLCAGGSGAAGLPPTSVPRLFDKSTLGLLAELSNGMPQPSTVIESTLPRAVRLVEDRIKKMLEGKPLSFAVDGGSSPVLICSRKLVVVVAAGLGLKYDVVLDVHVLERHETGLDVAELVDKTRAKYNIAKADVWYMCADNASTMGKAVDVLNSTMGYKIKYARCLPHCLNLIVKPFLDVFDKEFAFTTNLKLARSFLTAGGGVARKLLALEYGLSVSRVDFTDTRWASLVKALLYIANALTDLDMKKARERLEELAEAGDKTAQDALEEPDVKEIVFNTFYAFVESVSEESLAKLKEGDEVHSAEADLSKAKQKLLKFFSQPSSFAAFQAVDLLLGGDVGDATEKLPTLTTLTQGSPSYGATLSSSVTGTVPDVVRSVRNFMRAIDRLDSQKFATEGELSAEDVTAKRRTEQRLERLRKELLARMEKQFRRVVQTSRDLDQDMYDANKKFDEVNGNDFVVKELERYADKIEPKVMATVARAASAVSDSAGLEKLEECVSGLEFSQRFDLNNQPRDFEDDSALLRYLGCEDLPFREADLVLSGWRAVCESWVKPATQMSPGEVFAKWAEHSLDGSDPVRVVAKIAMRGISRPISAASTERLFSYLEHMSASDRANMVRSTNTARVVRPAAQSHPARPIPPPLSPPQSKSTLKMLLFLRGNWRLLADMVEEHNASVIGAAKKAREATRKRRVADDKTAAEKKRAKK